MLSTPLRWRAFALAAAALAAAAFAATLVRIDDPDTFHHLALGRDVVRNGLRAEEPFLYPFRGAETGPAPYWLGSAAIYGLHALVGDLAISLFPALLSALVAAVVLLDSLPRNGAPTLAGVLAATLPIALLAETLRYRAAARPEFLGALFFALTMLAIRRLEDGRPALLLAFPALALLWANVHPSILVGLVAIALFVAAGLGLHAASRLLRRPLPGTPPMRQLAIAAAVAAAGLLASAATPSPDGPVRAGLRFALAVFRTDAPGVLTRDPGLVALARSVAEMQGGGSALWTSPVGALIAVTALSLLAGRSAPVREIATAAIFAILPFHAVRLSLFFAVAAAPIAGRNLAKALSEVPERAGRFPARAAAVGAVLLAAAATFPLGTMAPHIRFGVGPVREVFPVRGTDYLEAIGFQGRLFNTFGLGGYLEWREVGPPFQDGRGLLLPADTLAAHLGPADRARFAALDASYRFDALLLARPVIGLDFARAVVAAGRTNDWVADRATWSLVAFDDGGLLYLRRDGKYAALASRDEFREANPANAGFPVPQADLPLLLGEFRRSVLEAPRCIRCRRMLAELALAAGRPAEAAAAVVPVLDAAYGEDREAILAVLGAASPLP